MNYTQIKQETLTGDADVQSAFNGSSLKRRRTDEYDDIHMTSPSKMGHLIMPAEHRSYGSGATAIKSSGKTFLHIHHSPFVYQTEDWLPKGCTMYLPLSEDVMVNTRNIEQISFESDQFFLADEKGNYVGAKPGNAIHLWRFDTASRKLYISRSILFLKDQEYQDIRNQLDQL